ncbi:MAG TPA: methyltransferase domain-containing protein [Kiritimatiellae bacterium]|nr:methyltransferase domain-containing protein [Kiritimatiellia bacterium]
MSRPRALHRFDRAADTYHAAADVQSAVASHLMELVKAIVPSLPAPSRILEIGAGTGVYSRLLRKHFPEAAVVVTDTSAAMLDRVRENVSGSDNLVTVLDRDGRLPVSGGFHLVTSSSALHWIPHLDRLSRRVAELLFPGGWFAFAMMVKGTLREIREAVMRIAPRKAHTRNLPDPHGVLRTVAASGLRLIHQELRGRQVTYPSTWEMLRRIHAQGVTGGIYGTRPPGLNRGELVRLQEYCDEKFAGPEGVRLSYRILYAVFCR